MSPSNEKQTEKSERQVDSVKPIVLVLGLGATIESRQPGTEEAVRKAIREHQPPLADDLYDRFYSIFRGEPLAVQRTILREFFREAGAIEGYQQLAELVINGVFDIILTTNPDRLLEESLLYNQFRDFSVFVVGSHLDEEIGSFLRRPPSKVKIIKLRGSLDTHSLRFTKEDLSHVPEPVQREVQRLTERHLLFAGYTQHDRGVLSLISDTGDAIWWVSYDAPTKEISIKLHRRNSAENILFGDAARFDWFSRDLHCVLTARELPEREVSKLEIDHDALYNVVHTAMLDALRELINPLRASIWDRSLVEQWQTTEMMNRISRLANLIDINESGAFVVFLGAGASIESGGPTTEHIVNDVVRRFGDGSKAGTPGRYEEFYRTLKRLGRGDRQAIFGKYFSGMSPSDGYLKLAELIKDGYFDVVLTTNPDNMLERAFSEVSLSPGSDYSTLVVDRDRGEEIRFFLGKARPRIKVVKLHGDLGSGVLRFTPEETYGFAKLITESLMDLTDRNMIFIGYRGVDRDVLSILNREGESIWWVSPSALDWNDKEERHILTILALRRSADNLISGSDGHFDAFVARLCSYLGL